MTTVAENPCDSCGMVHVIGVEEVVVGRDAREQLGRFADRNSWRRLLLVTDANTADALGDELAADLSAAGHRVDTHTFRTRKGLLANEDAVGAVRDRLAATVPDGVLAVGSGVINDITRYATFLDGQSYVAVPTAASMDGYASSVAAMQFDGVKVTLPTHSPRAIFADLAVLCAAPAEMRVWGFGDLAGKATARFDWLLGNGITGEPYCEDVAARVLGPLNRLLGDVGALVAGEEEAIQSLTTGLVESGIAMAMMGSSRPASGCEHHASHFWDLLAFQNKREHAPHGLQVGYATRWASAVQERSPAGLGRRLESAAGGGGGDDEREWLGEQYLALGPVRDEKQTWFATYGDSWPKSEGEVAALEGRLAEVVGTFPAIIRGLDAAGVPDGPGHLGVDRTTLRATLRYANRLRSRFTALDLLECQHLLDAVIEEVAAQ